jgi:prepilin-type N-terminal cleavage/methylation domain-containing protein
VSSVRSKRVADDGFTLVELVMAIVVLFIAMAAATQIVVSMVAATISNRHVDLAISVATQTMENSVAYDCGGQLLDPAAAPGEGDPTKLAATNAFYDKLQKRCLVDANSTATAAQDLSVCDATAGAANDPSNGVSPNPAKFLPAFDQAQTDLGSRRFTVRKSAASFNTAADGSVASAGTLPVCTTVRLTWKSIKSLGVTASDDGSNNSLRLERDVHVQWFEPRQTNVRYRDLTQVSAVAPDAKVAVNQGRISVVAGIGGWAKITMLNSSGPARYVTYAADDATGLVIFPFLPDGNFEVSTGASPVPVTISASSVIGRSVCVPLAGSIRKFDSTCHV